jgi:hypothetical protein
MRLEVTDREFHSIIAGLRALQLLPRGPSLQELVTIDDIATNGGNVEPLTAEEIAALAERLDAV